jgi:hypothetical protein
MPSSPRVRVHVAVAALVALAGCGYRFGAGARTFPPELRTIGIEALENDTREAGLEKRIALAIEREFAMRGPFRIASKPSEGDLVLSGTLRQAVDKPVAFNSKDEVLTYQTLLLLDLELRRRDTGALVWQAKGIHQTGDYETVASVIVTTSSEFRSSTLNAEDLGAFTDIQLAESRRRQTLDRMLQALAHDAYDQIMEDF